MDRITLNRRSILAGAGASAASVIIGTSQSTSAQAGGWSPLVTDGTGPAPRWDHHLAADSESQQLLLYGGRDANGAAQSDTWVFDIETNAWSPLEIEAPAPRFGAAIAEDRVRQRLYLLGGEDAATFYNDTWRFDFKSMSWRLQTSGENPAPSPRYGFAGVLDANDNFLVSHGFTFEGRFDDTWVFNTRDKTWTDVSPAPDARPLKRCLHGMARDPESSQTLLFGGCSSGFGPCPQGDLWAFDEETGAWTEITPASGPAARSDPAMIWDPVGSRAILIAGLTESGQVFDMWDGAFVDGAFSWNQIATDGEVPAARSSHKAVEIDGSIYLFGGTGPTGVLNDLWRFDVS